MAGRQQDRLSRHVAVELRERDERAREGDRADGRADRHLDQALRVDRAWNADAESFGRIQCGGRHANRGKTDKAVECGDELRHGRHGDVLRYVGADAAADGDASNDHAPAQVVLGTRDAERRRDRDGHADHAEGVALA